eukprot:snap_masked-scaffold_14-processed-gene-6.25-mRNA-1 protein AED:1.00 eAED:1.00 QI:0/-1/0/0/-1/1/1/0/347
MEDNGFISVSTNLVSEFNSHPPQQELLAWMESCQGDSKELNQRKIGAVASPVWIGDDQFIHIQNLNLSCFPQNPFRFVEFDILHFENILLEEVRIGIVEKNSLSQVDEYETRFVQFLSSEVKVMMEQEVDGFTLNQSTIYKYPRHIEAPALTFSNIAPLRISKNFINFFTSKPRRFIEFFNSLDDYSISRLERKLAMSRKKLHLTQSSYFLLRQNDISHIPGSLFSSRNVKFSDNSRFSFVSMSYLTSLSPNVFNGHSTSPLATVIFTKCPGLTTFPIAVLSLNLKELRFIETGLASLIGVNLSNQADLTVLDIRLSPVAKLCGANEEKFRFDFGIHESVLIPGCKI